MESEPGRSLILWTVRLSVLLYTLSLFVRFQKIHRRRNWQRLFGALWSGSWILCVVHVLCAYHFQHHWDQEAARRHTAEMTERVVGLHWSGGLYINYAFLALWGGHCLWWWALLERDSLERGSPERGSAWQGEFSRAVTGLDVFMHLIAGFMIFNATAVFGPRWWIVVASGVLVALAAVCLPKKPPRGAA